MNVAELTPSSARRSLVDVRERSSPATAGTRTSQSHPDASAYHRAAWPRVIGRAFGHETEILWPPSVTARVAGVLPLVFFAAGCSARFAVSLPFLNYGGVLADDRRRARPLLVAAPSTDIATGGRARISSCGTRGSTFRQLAAKRHKVAMALRAAATQRTRSGPRSTARFATRCARPRRAISTAQTGGAELLHAVLRGVRAQHARSRHAGLSAGGSSTKCCRPFRTRRASSSSRVKGQPVAACLVHWHGDTDRGAVGVGAARVQPAVRRTSSSTGRWCSLRSRAAAACSTSAARRRAKARSTSRSNGAPSRRRSSGSTGRPTGAPLPDLNPKNPQVRPAPSRVWQRLPLPRRHGARPDDRPEHSVLTMLPLLLPVARRAGVRLRRLSAAPAADRLAPRGRGRSGAATITPSVSLRHFGVQRSAVIRREARERAVAGLSARAARDRRRLRLRRPTAPTRSSQEYADRGVRLCRQPERRGKTAGLNRTRARTDAATSSCSPTPTRCTSPMRCGSSCATSPIPRWAASPAKRDTCGDGSDAAGRRRTRLLGLRDPDQAPRNRAWDRWSAATARSTRSAGRCGGAPRQRDQRLPEPAADRRSRLARRLRAGGGLLRGDRGRRRERVSAARAHRQPQLAGGVPGAGRAQPVPRRPVRLVARLAQDAAVALGVFLGVAAIRRQLVCCISPVRLEARRSPHSRSPLAILPLFSAARAPVAGVGWLFHRHQRRVAGRRGQGLASAGVRRLDDARRRRPSSPSACGSTGCRHGHAACSRSSPVVVAVAGLALDRLRGHAARGLLVLRRRARVRLRRLSAAAGSLRAPAGRRPSAVARSSRPSALFIAANDEAAVIAAKLQNSLALDYPADRLDDRRRVRRIASTAPTPSSRRFAPRVRLLDRFPDAAARSRAINEGMQQVDEPKSSCSPMRTRSSTRRDPRAGAATSPTSEVGAVERRRRADRRARGAWRDPKISTTATSAGSSAPSRRSAR